MNVETIDTQAEDERLWDSRATRSGDSSQSPTLANSAYLRLRRDIIEGTLKPGQKLRIEHLRDGYQIGASPLREALSRLAASGLVVAKDQQGFYVASVSPSEFVDLTKMRVWAETIALRSALTLGDREWEANIVACEHRMAQPRSAIAVGEWERNHADFHHALISGCKSPTLMSQCSHLQDLAERYRWLSLRQSEARRLGRDIEMEHRNIVQAVLKRDVRLATFLMQEHLLQTTEILLSSNEPPEVVSGLMSDLRREIAVGIS